ncbi:hypothetical protein BU15DRAFT_77351 [Melanogaster broomeanus]|nr:hypothetical protein BU15DRAFT_77351 [Melanogaster broomeanus]
METSRHRLYYFDDGSHVFRVKDTLYKLSWCMLSRHSQVLADMFEVGRGSSSEGQSDNYPIQLPDLSTSTFDLFIGHHFGYPRLESEYTNEELERFIAFCDKYQCSQTKVFVVNCLKAARRRFHPAEIIGIAVSYTIPELFRLAFRDLTEVPIPELTKLHRIKMGSEVFIAVAYAKALLDTHYRIVAAEEPPIRTHANDCQDSASCEEDWHAIWWNGMGRFLLDGRNPQPYRAAVRRFKEMRFGRVGKGCKEAMFKLIDEGAASKAAEHMITEVCDRLVWKLLFEPSSPV